MNNPKNNFARLKLPEGPDLEIHKTCSIGRSSGNDVVLLHEKVSRRHALIHTQEQGRFCFVDLGSSNGSYVNNRRVIQPVILKDGDVILIGSSQLIFGAPSGAEPEIHGDSQHTLHELRSALLWLLVADIQDSTRLSTEVGEFEVPRITGTWLAECKSRIEGLGGAINKFLGDGFLAYWPGETAPTVIADALSLLRGMQKCKTPSFRVVLHRGNVFLGGSGTLGEENLTGRDVNFVFRMEKLAAAMKTPLLVSSEARAALGTEFIWTPVGEHELSGFEGSFSFHSIGGNDV